MAKSLLAALCVSVLAAYSVADVIVIDSDRDNTIYEVAGAGLSNGQGTYMFSGSDVFGVRRRALVRFDLSGIPEGSTILHATLLLMMPIAAPGAETVELHRIIRDWGESGSEAIGLIQQTAGSTAWAGDATWDDAFHNTQPWNNPGGDYLSIPSGTVSVLGIGTYGWSSSLVLQDVRGWTRNEGTNFGWLLMHQDEASVNSLRCFHTHESGDISSRPKLIIDYLPPACATEYFCSSEPNSTGQPALMGWAGSCNVSEADFGLLASPVPNEAGLFFCSAGRANGGMGLPFGNGLRCVGNPTAPIQRLAVSFASNGVLSHALDFTNSPAASGQIASGTTWHFQAWYRDPLQGPAFYDLSDGVSVTFE